MDTACTGKGAKADWVVGAVDSAVGPVPLVSTKLDRSDRLGAVAVRFSIGRMSYIVEPGLYAVGSPTVASPVFVSANYKLSFDALRRELDGIDGWILVLDTKGINVWCAAGKGTFGTDELVRGIETTELARVISHRTIIVPQLGAPGVAAHEVKKKSGFRVVYGPIRAVDIRAFLNAGMKATPAMRRVQFTVRDRLTLVPVELVLGGKYAVWAAACLFLLAGLNRHGYDGSLTLIHGSRAALLIVLSLLAGAALTPLLLPWLPGRAFSVKGAIVGVVLGACAVGAEWIPREGMSGQLEMAAWLLSIPAIAAFAAMNYTGTSTFTSLSGVKKEMRFAIPLQIIAAATGLGLWIAARFA